MRQVGIILTVGFFAITVLSASLNIARAQTIPQLHATTFIAGEDHPRDYRSNDGHITIPGDPASFHYFGITSNDRDKLFFKVSCFFVNAAEQLKSTSTSDGSPCPPYGVENSRYIQALLIELGGSDANSFQLEMGCVVHFKATLPGPGWSGPEEGTILYQRGPAGSRWCGKTEPLSQGNWGISSLELWLTRH